MKLKENQKLQLEDGSWIYTDRGDSIQESSEESPSEILITHNLKPAVTAYGAGGSRLKPASYKLTGWDTTTLVYASFFDKYQDNKEIMNFLDTKCLKKRKITPTDRLSKMNGSILRVWFFREGAVLFNYAGTYNNTAWFFEKGTLHLKGKDAYLEA